MTRIQEKRKWGTYPITDSWTIRTAVVLQKNFQIANKTHLIKISFRFMSFFMFSYLEKSDFRLIEVVHILKTVTADVSLL